MKTGLLIVPLFALTLLPICAQSPQSGAPQNTPQYTNDGQLRMPENYREWIFLTSGLGMSYNSSTTSANPSFDNVFVTPQAYKAFMSTGTWPDKTMFALEVRSSSSEGSINKAGHFQNDITGLEVEVKDASRFPNKWAFFGFRASSPTAQQLPDNAGCQACHSANGAVDNTFVQFYPTLIPIAKAKGTFKAKP